MTLNEFFAYHPEDTAEIRLEKFTIFLVAGACCIAGGVWTAMYYSIFSWGLTTALPLSFVIIVGTALVISHYSKNHKIAIYTQIISIMYITAFIQWSLGGVFDSGFVMMWSFIGPMIALMFFNVRQSIVWIALYIVNLFITVAYNDFFASLKGPTPDNIRLMFFLMNMGIASIVIFVFASYYVHAAIESKKREEVLKQQLTELKVQIDQAKREQDVAEIANTEFFQSIREHKKGKE